jgi:hypothetical protein
MQRVKGGQAFMGTILILRERFLLFLLLTALTAVLAMTGCTNGDQAPYGSTVTVDVQSTFSTGASSTLDMKGTTYIVMVKDPSGVPMNGVKVDLQGSFDNGYLISMNGSVGSAPVLLSSSITMGDYGYKTFLVSAPSITQRQIFAPTTVTTAPVSGGGTLSNGTYYYAVTCRDAASGETNAPATYSVVLSDGTATQSVAISWTAVPGAASYRVYGRSSAIPASLGLLSAVTGTTNYVDAGGTPGAAPPGTNTTGLALNSVTGSIMATSGGAITITDIAF